MGNDLLPTLCKAFESYYEELKVFISRKVRCTALASDIMQDAWLRIALDRSSREPVQNVRAYLYRVTSNLAIDRLRQMQAQSRRLVELDLPEKLGSSGPNPDKVIEGREDYAALVNAIRELPDRCRAAFLLYRVKGLSMREVASVLGVSEKTVEKHIAKAMVHCRRRLREAGRQV